MTSPQQPPNSTRFLIVDDNPEHRYLLQSILQGSGYKVEVAEHGADALEKARSDPPDLLVSDILMPVMDGFRLCNEWKSDDLLKSIPFVFYTATYTHAKDQRLAQDLGAEMFIQKPQDPDTLLDLLSQVLHQKQDDSRPDSNPQTLESSLKDNYTEVLVHKLEDKIEELELTRLKLEKELLERQLAEKSLRSSETLFRAVIEDQTEFIVRWLPGGIRTFVNKSYCDYFQCKPEDAIGTSFYSLCSESDIETVKARIASLSPSNPVSRDSHQVVLPNGGHGWQEWTDRAIFDDEGNIVEYQSVGRDITDRVLAEKKLRNAMDEIRELKERVEAENIYLKQEIRSARIHGNIVGSSSQMKSVLTQAEQVAATDTTALILGETGTGKELLARAIHSMSSRKDKMLVIVNCAAMPEMLVESELFGREKGAYTGASTKQAGRFEIAHESTLFLDEIGELPLAMQVKILRVLQEGQFERLGSSETHKVDVRIIAATNRNLEEEVEAGRFRQDLFYRLNVFPITLPPLRDRTDDIPPLVWAMVEEFCEKMGKRIESIPRRTMETLQAYSWPGNVRELRNVIERGMIKATGRSLQIELPGRIGGEQVQVETLTHLERRHISKILERTRWRVRGKGGAAEILGLKPTTLESRMRKLEIKRPR